MSQIGCISQFFLKTPSKIYKTSIKHLQRDKFPFNNVLSENSLKRLLTWSQLRKRQALRREGNKVEVLEGKFRTFTYVSHV